MKILTLAFLLMTTSTFAQTPLIETGVSQSLAKWRSANYSDVRYRLNITLEKGAPLMKGDIEIRVNMTEEGAKNDLILDWRTTQFANDKNKPFANVMEVNDTKVSGTKAETPVSSPENVADNAKSSSVSQNIRRSFSFTRYNFIIGETLADQSNEHLLIPHNFLKKGENVIKINFASPIKTSGAAVTRYVDKEDNAEYVYSLFVPSDASTAFPVFDQPDLKARFDLTIKTPDSWKVVSNTPLKRIQTLPTTHSEDAVKKLSNTAFEETQPISSYVFAFAAGEFTEFEDSTKETISDLKPLREDTENNGLVTRIYSGVPKIYVRKSQAEKFKQHAAEVFRLNREGVKFLEDWFDYKFPFPKYDLVLIPEFPFGGMEHAGATFLREDRIIFPTEPTKNDYITRANVIFHEAAHQWFGDTVTMKWFDDLWLKEGFAEFMAYKTLAKVMPEYNAWKIFYERNKQAAYLTDVTRGTTPIYQEIPNLSSAKSAYGNIVYRKAPSFLRQAEFYLGEDKFQTAVRQFLKKHEFANASWEDLVSDFAKVKYNLPESGGTINAEQTQGVRELLDWANGWIKQRGQPIIKLENNSISQKDSLNKNSKWTEKFQIYTFEKNPNPEYKDFVSIDSVLLNKSNQPIKLSPKATFIFPNYQDYGYGIFLLDEKSRAYILKNIQTEKDDFLRSMMWGSLWDSVRFYELAPADYVKLVIKNINIETDESTIQFLLGRVSTVMNYYISKGGNPRVSKGAKNNISSELNTLPNGRVSAKDELATEIENLLIEKIETAPSVGQKITYFRALQSIGSSEQTKQIFKDLLTGKSKLKEVELKTKDKFDLVTRLIILGDKDALNLLAELEKTETNDAAKRYAYAARAGIATKENKAKYWKDFTNNKEISESWIEAAFSVWNTPHHAELTLPYLEKALAELPNLKKNRKIFFVNGWLSSFIGGQKSAEALAIVNKFLADNPNLERDLRLKILENADNLERAVKIRAKFAE